MKRTLIVLAVALLGACSSSKQPPSALPESPPSNFVVVTPTGYSAGQKYPMVMIFHGRPGSPEDIADRSGFNDLVESENFIAVYPNQVFSTEEVVRLLDHLQRNWSVDPQRIYATGFSVGAALTYQIGEQLADRFAAVAPVSGTGARPVAHTGPISLLAVQGGLDRAAPSFPTVNSTWAEASGCGEITTTTITMGGGPTHRYSAQCDGGAEHVVYSVTQLGHFWLREGTPIIWEFFRAHPKPALAS